MAADRFNEEPIVIIGAGPTGILTALGALKKGYNVVLITKYDIGLRSQKVKLDNDTVKFLKEFMDPNDSIDQAFFKKLKANKNTISVSQIEEFLDYKLKKAVEAQPQQLTYISGDQGELTKVDTINRTVTVTYSDEDKTEKIIPFKHLVDASGTRREAFRQAAVHENSEKIWREMASEGKYPNTPNYEREFKDRLEARNIVTNVTESMETGETKKHFHYAQGTGIYYLPRTEFHNRPHTSDVRGVVYDVVLPETIHIPTFSESMVKELRDTFGWEQEYPPTIYIISDAASDPKFNENSKKQMKFYVGGEIPSKILEEKDENIKKQKVAEWQKFVLEHHFSIMRDKFITRQQLERGDKKYETHKAESDTYQERYSDPKAAAKKKTDQSITAFKLILTRIKTPVVDISTNKNGEHVMVALGDANQAPHFHKAHGMNDAVRGARKFLKHLETNSNTKKPTFNVGRFKRFIDKLRKQHEERLASIAKEYADKKQTYSAETKEREVKRPDSPNTSSPGKILAFFKRTPAKQKLPTVLPAVEVKQTPAASNQSVDKKIPLQPQGWKRVDLTPEQRRQPIKETTKTTASPQDTSQKPVTETVSHSPTTPRK